MKTAPSARGSLRPIPWILALFLLCNLRAWSDSFDHWSLKNPLPTAQWAQDVAFGNGRLVAVGQDLVGAVLTSLDGITWAESPLNGRYSFSSIRFGSSQFAAIGYDSNADPFSPTNTMLWHSTNGIDWFPAVASELYSANLLAYGGGHFVLVGTKRQGAGINFMIESTWVSQDGALWIPTTDRVLADSDWAQFSSLGYANGRFVGLTSQYSWVSSDASFWQRQSLDVTNASLTLFVAGDRFFAMDLRARVVSPGHPVPPSYVYTSEDGITWTTHEFPYPAVVHPPLGCIKGLFVSFDEDQLFTSADGLDWTQRALDLPLPIMLFKLESAFGGLVGVGASLVGGDLQALLISSPDGLKWIDHVEGIRGGSLTGAVFGMGRWVAVGSPVGLGTNSVNFALARVAHSGWQPVLLPRSLAYYSGVAAGSAGFAAVGYAATEGGTQPIGAIAFSADGMNWMDRTPKDAPRLASITYGNGLFVVPADQRVFTSPDAENWTQQSLPTQTNFVAGKIAFGDGRFVCLGRTPTTVYVSTNGTDWIAANPGFTGSDSMRAIAYGGGRFVILRDGSAAVSTNGVDWTAQLLPSNPGLVRDVTWADGSFVAVRLVYPASGPPLFSALWTSTDGLVWTQKPFAAVGVISALAPGPDSVLIVGERAKIFESDAFVPGVQPPWLELRPDSALRLLLHGTAGRNYRIDRRISLSPTDGWLLGNTLSATNDTTALGLDVMNNSKGFYRAVQLPN